MLGPPLVVSDAEVDELVELTAQAVEAATSWNPDPACLRPGPAGPHVA
jgi:hypothetical protein